MHLRLTGYGVLSMIMLWNQEKQAFAEHGRRMLRGLLENAMKAELVGYLKTRKYEHTRVRIDYRNGYYHRNLVTSPGLLPALSLPPTRNSSGKRLMSGSEAFSLLG